MTPSSCPRATRSLVLGVLSGACAAAVAQTATPAEPQRVEITGAAEPYQPPPTSAATKTDTPILLTPQSVQVVPRAVLNEQKALTLIDAIRNVAGTGGDFGFNGSAQPLILLRGFQTESMTASGPMSGMSTYFINGVKVKGVPINMANVDAVEVVKGPASVLYGRAEPGGLVNVVPRALSATPSFGFEQTLGQYDQSRTIVEGGGALNGDKTVLGRANLSYDTAKSNRDFVENRMAAFSGTLAWIPNADTRIALTYDRNAQKYRNDFGVYADGNRPARVPRSLQFNNAPELSSFDNQSLTLDAQTRLSAAWTLKARAVTMRAKTQEVDIWPYRVDLGAGSGPADSCVETNPLQTMCRYYYFDRPDGRVRLDQATVDLQGDLRWGGFEHKLLFEIDHYENRRTGALVFAQIKAVDVRNPDFSGTPTIDQTGAPGADTRDVQRWTSVVAQDQIGFGHGWHAVFALRHDRTAGIYTSDPSFELNRQSFTTPRVGVVYEVAPSQTLYAQYQEAVAANNGRNPSDGAPLAAERARQLEAGWKSRALEDRLNTTVAVFQLVKRNRADYTLYPVINTIGEARSRGLEVDLLGQLSRQLALMASYAYLDAKITDNGQYAGTRLANAARHSGSFWGRWMFDAHWAAGAGVFFQSQREGDQLNSFQLPGYGRVDAMLSYAFRAGSGKGSVQFNLKNAFDKLYYSGSHPGARDWIQPGAPRTASVTLRLDH